MTRTPWWRGTRGEWHVVVQFIIIALAVLGPRTWPGVPEWRPRFAFLGWALKLHSTPALVYSLLLFIILDIKARAEERWLMEKFPEYAAYRRRVRRLIPFIY